MELKEFLEKFLPDYSNKWTTAINETPNFYDDEQKKLWACYHLFPKALPNFSDKICEKQRELCAQTALIVSYSQGLTYDEVVLTEQPKIEEL